MMLGFHLFLANLEQAIADFEKMSEAIVGVYVELVRPSGADSDLYEWTGESLDRREGTTLAFIQREGITQLDEDK